MLQTVQTAPASIRSASISNGDVQQHAKTIVRLELKEMVIGSKSAGLQIL